MTAVLIVPQDVLNPRRPDEHFADEAAAARDAGWTVALVDHDLLARGGAAPEAVRRVPAGRAVYRGWMLSADRYAEFHAALLARDVTPLTDPVRFRRAHELPGWYAVLADLTPRTTWTTGPVRADFEDAVDRLGGGSAVLRDWTKSMKHHWAEAAYLPDLSDREQSWAVATRFLELRDDEFTGGFVLRRFEELRSAEVRTWWARGRPVAAGAHPDTPDQDQAADIAGLVGDLEPLVAQLDVPFVTVDLTIRADGVWRVMELGDGQVSDRPSTMAPEAMIDILTAALS